MKPPPFEYYAPTSREEALALLAAHGGEAKALAGGQSLVPSMNFRLAAPAILVDLNGVADLFGIAEVADGGLRIGAMTRQHTLERSPLVAEHAPLLSEAMPFIAHPQIRNRGTVGGSLAHNDPAAELPALMIALGAQFRAQSATGARLIPATDFFQGVFTTALEPDELLVEISVPPLPPRSGMAFAEVARRHGDYALAGAAAVVTLAADGTVAESRLVFFSVSDGPLASVATAPILQSQLLNEEAIRAATEAAVGELDPPTDIHASAAYRRHLAGVLARRVLGRAAARALAMRAAG